MSKRFRTISSAKTGMHRAITMLASGELVAIPTETVYGLAADATNPKAIASIYATKNRPRFNPLIAHVEDIAAAEQQGVFDERARALAERFWPGSLTLVVPARSSASVAELARAGLSSIALRVPSHPVAQRLLQLFNRPLVAPSANRSGQISPTSADDVAAAFGDDVALVLDGGRCEAGIESTILSILPDEPVRLLRPGAISREALVEVVGALAAASPGEISAPGQLSSHYAPRAPVRLGVERPLPGESWLGFGPDCDGAALNLSCGADLVEAAANLYQMLRALDDEGADAIAVAPVPAIGLGEAINDRLRRAAAPRDSGN